eukprot:SAG31_NODE_9064_length_1341_cov_1.286634_3_plen_30_part_01
MANYGQPSQYPAVPAVAQLNLDSYGHTIHG